MNKPDPIPARLAALKTTPTPDLKKQWRDLFDSEPPPFNRRYLESRLAYRIQELAYGGLKPETVRRLERLGEELDGGDRKKSRVRADTMPIAGTRLIREWQGVEHGVTVIADGIEWQGRPYKSISAIARAITMKPELVRTSIHQVVNATDYGHLLKALKGVSRPFAVAVINSVEDAKS